MELFLKRNSVIKIRHIGIVVGDMGKSLFFYRDLLGFKDFVDTNEHGEYIDKLLSLENVDVRTVKLEDDNGVIIELLKFHSHPRSSAKREIVDNGCSHFALTVDSIDDLYLKLKNENVYFNSEPQVSVDGCVKVVFCKDPDGTFIELVEILK